MQKILLLSSGRFLINNTKVFEKPFKDMKMAYVITASKGVENLDYIERERKFFKDQNFNYQEVDLDGKSSDELRDLLKNFEIVYVTGGNTFYLLKSIRQSGFDKIIRELISQGLVYMGASAGSYVMCPSIEMATWEHQNKYNHCGVDDLTGLNSVPFLITAHFKPEYKELIQEKIKNTKYPVKILTDEQAILIQDDKVELIGSGSEIIL
ncbi:MAG: Type 1 glutamine amidotransferase-like domain-containing protein [Patescibacteria group bacterium]